MFIKFLVIFLTSLLFVSMSCFAEVVKITAADKVRTNEPDDTYLGMKIDLQGQDFVERITVNRGKFLLVDQSLTDVRIKKDKTNGLNKFYALVAYNLYVNNSKQSPTRFLYVQCPVTRTTYLDRSPHYREDIIDGVDLPVKRVNMDNFKTEVLDSGSYSFLSSPEDKVPLLSNNFPMAGKVSQHFDIEIMCLKIQLTHAEYQWAETFRQITLEKFGISE